MSQHKRGYPEDLTKVLAVGQCRPHSAGLVYREKEPMSLTGEEMTYSKTRNVPAPVHGLWLPWEP